LSGLALARVAPAWDLMHFDGGDTKPREHCHDEGFLR
jgi:hypothetical protein